MTNTQNWGQRTLVLKVAITTIFYLCPLWRFTPSSTPGFQIVLRKNFNRLVQKSFLSTTQPGSSMINQISWIRCFDPNDMLWRELDVECDWMLLFANEVVECGRRGEEWIREALVGWHCRYPEFCIGLLWFYCSYWMMNFTWPALKPELDEC